MLTLAWYFYLKLVALTSRIRVVSATQDSIVALREKRPVIYVFWYRHIIFLLYFLGVRRLPILLTPNGRSDRMIRLAAWMGLKVARGSLEGGGRHALLTMLEKLKENSAIAIPADGARGPERKCKAGAFILAQESSTPIVPISWHAALRIKIPRRTGPIYIPLPFNLIEIRLGTSLPVGRHYQFSELEGVRAQLSTMLDRLM